MNAMAVSLLIRSGRSTVGESLERSLAAAGLGVVVVPSVYDAVVEGARARDVRLLAVGVDYFGQQDFRLFPLARREWPQTCVVAYHAPGFEHKGRLAELVGADRVLSSEDDVRRFVESLAPPVQPADAKRTEPSAVAEPPPIAEPPAVKVSAPAPLPAPPSPEATSPAPPRPPAASVPLISLKMPPAPPIRSDSPLESIHEPLETTRSAPPPQDPAMPLLEELLEDEELLESDVVGTVELTDEELRLLLGEEDEA